MATFKLRGIAILTIGILIGSAFLVAVNMDIKSNSAKKEQILAKQSLTSQAQSSDLATTQEHVVASESSKSGDTNSSQASQTTSTPTTRATSQNVGSSGNDSNAQSNSSNSGIKFAGFKPSENSADAKNNPQDEEQEPNGAGSDADGENSITDNAQGNDSQEMVRNFYEQPSYTKVVAKFPSADFVAGLAAHDGALDGSISSVSMTHLETCEVVQVLSGDQFFCRLPNGLRQKFILYGIASPRADQSYGLESKNALHNLLVGKKIFYYPVAYDEYSRLSVLVYVNNFEVNLLQVFNGNVFLNPYAKLDSRYELAQNKAHDDYVGLWNQRNWIGGRPPINPFTERK